MQLMGLVHYRFSSINHARKGVILKVHTELMESLITAWVIQNLFTAFVEPNLAQKLYVLESTKLRGIFWNLPLAVS